MTYLRNIAAIACLAVSANVASPATLPPPQTPLKVSLSLVNANACPLQVMQSVGLRAAITGGYTPVQLQLLHGATKYDFYATNNDTVIQQNSANPLVWWLPRLPGFYNFGVTAKQIVGGNVVAQATGALSGLCEVKKVTYQVTLTVTPVSGQADAPPSSDAKKLKVTASVSVPGGGSAGDSNAFSFAFRKMNGPVVVTETFRDPKWYHIWTPPGQPAEPGLYVIDVAVSALQSSPHGDVTVADGQKEISYYEVKAASPFGSIPVHTGDPTVTKGAPASQVSLTVMPLSPSPTAGVITMGATVTVPGNPAGVTNKFTSTYASSSGGQPVVQTFPPTSGASQSWTLSPEPAPGTYTLTAKVETRRTADNTLLAQGSAQIANYVVAGATYPFGWLFPVTTQNTALAVGMTYGSATNTIAGNTLADITNKGSVRVRADNSACAQCHGGSFTQSGFCSQASLYSSVGPHATSGQAADQTLASLFNNWKSRNCPN